VTRANKFLGFGASGEITALPSTGTAPSSVDTGNIVDNAVTQAKIANDAVGTAQLASTAVTTAKIADNAVTAAKLSSDAAFAAGMLMPFAGTSAPTGWLLAHGQAVSRETYAGLFAAISTTYGNGDGSTTFNLPDLRGRTVAGKDDMGGSSANRLTDQSGGLNGDTLGDTGGEETHTLSVSEIPAHNHSTNGGSTSVNTSPYNRVGMGAGGILTGPTIQNTGGGGAHNNVQPTIILNYIIKT